METLLIAWTILVAAAILPIAIWVLVAGFNGALWGAAPLLASSLLMIVGVSIYLRERRPAWAYRPVETSDRRVQRVHEQVRRQTPPLRTAA